MNEELPGNWNWKKELSKLRESSRKGCKGKGGSEKRGRWKEIEEGEWREEERGERMRTSDNRPGGQGREGEKAQGIVVPIEIRRN
jgi:hypothetical protein